jgi:two-component system chemotaxis sensor kinase CheA
VNDERKKNDEFMKKLVATFRVEAGEHIQAISLGLVELEKTSSPEKQTEITETIFREAHSLKGAARAVNMTLIETTCQALESVFSDLKRRTVSLSPSLFDELHPVVDALHELVSHPTEPTPAQVSRITELIQDLKNRPNNGSASPKSRSTALQGEHRDALRSITTAETRSPGGSMPALSSAAGASPAETVRISASRLTSLLLQAEELRVPKLASIQRATELRDIRSALATVEYERAKIRFDVRKIEQYLEKHGKDSGTNGHLGGHDELNAGIARVLAFLVWDNNNLGSIENKVAKVASSAEQDHRALGSMVDNLAEDMRKTLVFPCSWLFESFPKIVRDLSHDSGKHAELTIQGGDIEIDRRILEQMKDPLIHLLRNCVDHGIESDEERKQHKKPVPATITVTMTPKASDKVEILIRDDGAGIDAGKVRAAALKLGVLSRDKASNLSEEETLSLIFQSGVSTSPIITDLSGRGLGLAIVREKVEKLGGHLSIETRLGAGTTFRILLPLTLATFQGVLVRAHELLFVLPTSHVERVLRMGLKEIKTAENRETIEFEGRAVSLVRLQDVLGLPAKNGAGNSTETIYVLILHSAGKRIAFSVDQVLGEQEVLVKRLGPHLARLRNVMGATVLGTGEVVPILDVPDLMNSAVKAHTFAPHRPTLAEKNRKESKSVLIVEDSITARTLLKTIVESAGYTVKTAVDGLDALATLKTEQFDLIVSDVEMPRMNGFDLTAKVRADEKISHLPVVLVTSLESREDRERGIDVGANAYIVKSSFDHGNLLEVVGRLV